MTDTLPITPDLDGFRQAATERRVIPVVARLVADTITPIGLYAKLAGNRPGTYLLESATQTGSGSGGSWGRWSFVGVHCAATLTVDDGRACWAGEPPAGICDSDDPLEVLADLLQTLHTPLDPDLPPFTSGMIGYLGYDIARRLETLPDTCVDDLQIPEMMMSLATDLAVLDHHTGDVWLIANAINLDGSDARMDEAWADAVSRVQRMARDLAADTPTLVLTRHEPGEPEIRHRTAPGEFQQAVRRVVAEIEAGEAFQVVPSQRFDVPTTADAFDIYRCLRVSNPSPYLYLMRLGDFDIVGSSPEALVTVDGRRAITRPIAGTRPRGATPEEDARLEAELVADEKERAEHVMLVDLGRNDLGRVCTPGTVEVTEFMKVARYSHVMHLEAAVVGELAADKQGLDAVLACFPAGTLSGAPKVRAMEIIDELEPTRRGLYGGVVGYFDFAGNADTAIAIRTAVIKDQVAHVQAGAGVVADSDPDSEDAESRNKAAAVIRAIQLASGRSPL